LIFNNSTIKKTDISVLVNLRLSQAQREIVILLKKWKNDNELPLSSHLIEHLVMRSYSENRGKIPKGLTAKILMVIKFIRENLTCLRITGSENSNNILTDFDPIDKLEIVTAADRLIKEYEYQPNSIVSNFI
jgi:SUMO ligase MMS21 Smc5/6 complex component